MRLEIQLSRTITRPLAYKVGDDGWLVTREAPARPRPTGGNRSERPRSAAEVCSLDDDETQAKPRPKLEDVRELLADELTFVEITIETSRASNAPRFPARAWDKRYAKIRRARVAVRVGVV